MAIRRHFLDWNEPLTSAIRKRLLPAKPSGPVDLGDILIVTPTQQAGRRLREEFAAHCARNGTGLLASRVVPPTFLFAGDNARDTEAVVVKAVWAEVLLHIAPADFSAFFPTPPAARDFSWAVGVGEMLQRLRNALADGGYRLADVVADEAAVLEEPDRWADMARLEALYSRRLAELGLDDPCDAKILRAGSPAAPEGVERIVVAAVPDPSLLVLRALTALGESMPVDLLVYAPEAMAGDFDEWGRPLPDAWAEAVIDIPAAAANVRLAGSPAAQARAVIDMLAGAADAYGPADVAIGVPDAEVVPSLETALADCGLPAFNPADKAVRDHSLFHLLDAWNAVLVDASYGAVSRLLRHPDMLRFFKADRGLAPRALLAELDDCQNFYLPTGLADLLRPFASAGEAGPRAKFPQLAVALDFVRTQVEAFGVGGLAAPLRALLATVFGDRTVDSHNVDDQDLARVAEKLDDALRELPDELLAQLGLDGRRAMRLLVRRLAEQTYHREREPAVVDLEGWLELPWNGAAFLIVTGMNEGAVPDGRLSDVFLPDSLRRRLGLRDDAGRLARDAYLMRSFIASRVEGGRVGFISGKTSNAGDPLKPSRLLFRCPDAELPGRAERLFGSASESRRSPPATIGFQLEPALPADVADLDERLARVPVTAFRDYLACPFRFYLKHVLGMRAQSDDKGGLDALDFGIMVHHALQRMAERADIRGSEDERVLGDFLATEVEAWTTRRFGPTRSLPVMVSLDAARQRLRALAAVQAGLTRDGWEILRSEQTYQCELNGVIVRGAIDRIDRHRATGALRVIDYKTTDAGEPPDKTHLASVRDQTPEYARVAVGKRSKRWIDLQLPLYRRLLADDADCGGGPLEVAYFNLPKAVGATAICVWDDLTDELYAAAGSCAEAVADDIRGRRFWPPAARMVHDDFEAMFPAGVEAGVRAESLPGPPVDGGGA